MPMLAVCVDGDCSSAGEGTRKARNLAGDPRCVLTVEQEPFDLVVEASASKVRDGATLDRVAGAYASIHGWRVTVREGAFDGTEGAQPRALRHTTWTSSRLSRRSPSASTQP
jgi:hypothetical protein